MAAVEVQMQEWLVEYEDHTYTLNVAWDGRAGMNSNHPQKQEWCEVAADGFVAATWQELGLADGDTVVLKLTAPSSQCFKLVVTVQVEARALILESQDVS